MVKIVRYNPILSSAKKSYKDKKTDGGDYFDVKPLDQKPSLITKAKPLKKEKLEMNDDIVGV